MLFVVDVSESTLGLLRLTLVDGVGPVLGRRLLAAFSSAGAVFEATPAALERVQGIGATKARRMCESVRASEESLARELEQAARLGVRVIGIEDASYPPMLRECPDAPLVLYVRGADPCGQGTYPAAIVGSRHCTQYGVEQAERFATGLGQAGLVVVSGGARGVDSAAHRACARLGFPTVVVLGCGLGHCYPPENAGLFEEVVARGGTIVSELPINVGPSAENFPARNRIIVGLSLGVVVIEAPRGSGALITARLAIDEYNREVLAVPGRVDSRASEGSNELIKRGEAALAMSPSDVIDALEIAARHLHGGTHGARYGAAEDGALGDGLLEVGEARSGGEAMFEAKPGGSKRGVDTNQALSAGRGGETMPNAAAGAARSPATAGMTEAQRRIVEALDSPRSIDELCRVTGLAAHTIQAEVMLLEIRRVVMRQGSKLARRSAE